VAYFDVAPIRDVPAGQLARADVHDAFDNGWMHMALDLYQRASVEQGIEDRHPFFDRRVVEFALSLPDEQRWQRGRTRHVLRRAMNGRLPAIVRDRPDIGKGDLSHLYEEALATIGGRGFFEGPLEVAARGWVVAAEARRLYDRMRAQHARRDAGYGDSAFRLWNIAALELWHQGVFGVGRSSWRDQDRPHESSAPMGPPEHAGLTGVQC
jgi:asparagine synthase (glutamine-hydrolysing)